MDLIEKARKKLSTPLSYFVNTRDVIELYSEGLNNLNFKQLIENDEENDVVDLETIARELYDLYIKIGDYKSAAETIDKYDPKLAVECYKRCGLFRKCADIKKRIAYQYFYEKDYELALVNVNESLAFFNLVNKQFDKSLLELKAECYFWMDKFEPALQSYIELSEYLLNNKLLKWGSASVLQKCCLLYIIINGIKDANQKILEYENLYPLFKNSSEYKTLEKLLENKELPKLSDDQVQKQLFEMINDRYFINHPHENLDYYRGFVVGLKYGRR